MSGRAIVSSANRILSAIIQINPPTVRARQWPTLHIRVGHWLVVRPEPSVMNNGRLCFNLRLLCKESVFLHVCYLPIVQFVLRGAIDPTSACGVGLCDTLSNP